MGDISCSNGIINGGNGKRHSSSNGHSHWHDEEIEENLLQWRIAFNSVLCTGTTTQKKDIALIDTKPFGKALVIDGKLQSAEEDEFIYHESLVHPPLLHHSDPKSVFIMGGGAGSTAREILRHKTINKVVMCDIDERMVDFCKDNLDVNKDAFKDARLEIVINDPGKELKSGEQMRCDVIIGDLADPIEQGPCYKLYTKSFYESTVKPKLNHGGIFVTQAGPAGFFSHKKVFSCIYNTLKHVFKHVEAYSTHIPSSADTWGWVMASDAAFDLSADELDQRIEQRMKGKNKYFDGKTFSSDSTLSKPIRESLDNETHVYTEGTSKLIKKPLPKAKN